MEWVVLLGILLALFWASRILDAENRRAVDKGLSARTSAIGQAASLDISAITGTQPELSATLPFACRVESHSRAGVFYTVTVDGNNHWSCTCPDYRRESLRLGRQRYFCKHCIRIGQDTGLKEPKRWRAKHSGEWLVGEMVAVEYDDGNADVRMSVDGYLTTREIREVLQMPEELAQEYLFDAGPDEVAIFGYGDEARDGAELYEEARVLSVMGTQHYQDESVEIQRNWEEGREAREKRSAAMKAAWVRRREREAAEEAKRRAAFGGRVWIARCVYTYGWLEYGVYAKDADQAKKLMTRWLRSDEGKEDRERLYDDAICEHCDLMETYREDRNMGVSTSALNRPPKPLKRDFALHLEERIKTSDIDTAKFQIEEVLHLREGGGWYEKYSC